MKNFDKGCGGGDNKWGLVWLYIYIYIYVAACCAGPLTLNTAKFNRVRCCFVSDCKYIFRSCVIMADDMPCTASMTAYMFPNIEIFSVVVLSHFCLDLTVHVCLCKCIDNNNVIIVLRQWQYIAKMLLEGFKIADKTKMIEMSVSLPIFRAHIHSQKQLTTLTLTK